MHPHAKAILGCVSATAAAMLVMTSAFAAGDTTSMQPPTQKVEQPTTAIPIAVFNLAVIGPTEVERNGPTDPAAPVPGGAEITIIGAASFYDIPGETASGEQYDPKAFTAAAQLEIRDKFGGIRFGRLYQVSYAVAEYAGKKLILKFNDVGPLRPGRMFDLSRAAMEYFDGLDKGVLPDVKVTVLPLGQAYTPGPVTDEQLVAMGLANAGFKLASVAPTDARESSSEQGAIQLPTAPVDTAPAPVAVTDPCGADARACEDTSVAAAQVSSPMTAPQDFEPVNAGTDETMRPTIDFDRWEVVETWPLRGAHYSTEEGVCSSGGC
jgi:rare lipoprotein A